MTMMSPCDDKWEKGDAGIGYAEEEPATILYEFFLSVAHFSNKMELK